MSRVDKSDSRPPKPASDVGALYAEIGLDPREYREFEPSLPTRAERTETFIAPKRSNAEGFPRPVRPTHAADASTTRRVDADNRAPGDDNSRPRQAPVQDGPEDRFRLLDRMAHGGTRRPFFQAPVIGILSSAGGVGKSTVAAALAVALAERTGRCSALAHSSISLLPCYLGGVGVAEGRLGLYDNLPVGSPDSLQLALGDAGLANVLHYASVRVGDARCVIVDVETGPGAVDALQYLDRALVILRPDISALIGIERLEAARKALGTGPKPTISYVINQYDDGLDVHRQVRRAIAERVDGRLFQPQLPAESRVQAALADGRPPQATCPGSGFAQGVEQIATNLSVEIDERRLLANA